MNNDSSGSCCFYSSNLHNYYFLKYAKEYIDYAKSILSVLNLFYVLIYFLLFCHRYHRPIWINYSRSNQGPSSDIIYSSSSIPSEKGSQIIAVLVIVAALKNRLAWESFGSVYKQNSAMELFQSPEIYCKSWQYCILIG